MFDAVDTHTADVARRARATFYNYQIRLSPDEMEDVERLWAICFRNTPIYLLDEALGVMLAARGTLPPISDIAAQVRVFTCGGTRLDKIIEAVSIAFDVETPRILGRSQRLPYARPRQAVYLLADEAGYALSQTGAKMHRDRTSVIHGIAKAKENEAKNPDFAIEIGKARHILAGTDAQSA